VTRGTTPRPPPAPVRSDHYGWEVAGEGKGLFVSFVPIVVDTFFKLWLFTAFNRQSPSTVATLKEMDRH